MNRERVWSRGKITAVLALTGLIAFGGLYAFADLLSDNPHITTIWPISVIERLSNDRTFTHALTPLFTRSRSPEVDRVTVRPISTRAVEYGSDSEQTTTVDFLPPLGHAVRSANEQSCNFFPLFHTRQWTDADGSAHSFTSFFPFFHHRVDGPAHHTAFVPFYMSGTAGSVSYPIPFKSTRDYSAVFPFYGNLYGAFGNDRVTFAFWPLYTRIEKTYRTPDGRPSAAGPFVKHQFLYPIFTFGSGGGYKSFKIWPLYGQTVKEGEYVSRFVAWPIFNFTKNLNSDTSHAKNVMAGLPVYWDIQDGAKFSQSLFPLYGKRTMPDFERSFRLWPLYINTKYIKEGYTTRDYLWPVFSKTEGTTEGFKIWPLYGVRKQRQMSPRGKSSEDVSAFYLWTLGKYERSVRPDSRRVYNRLFPLYVFGRYDDEAGYRQRQVFLWPIISYQEDTLQDAKAVSFLNLLGTFEAHFPAIQEVYSPLWRVIDYARQGEEERLSILWNFISVRKDHGNEALTIGPFFQFHRSDTGAREYTLLTAFHLHARPSARSSDTARRRNSPETVATLRSRVSGVLAVKK